MPLSLQLIPVPTPVESIDLITQLRAECGWDADQVPKWVQEAKDGLRVNFFCVEEADGSVVGFISLVLHFESDLAMANRETHTAMIKSLFIRNEHQNKGYGKEAMRAIEVIAGREYDVKTVTLDTGASMKKNMALYYGLGYTEFREPVKVEWCEAGAACFSKQLGA
ncbi:hypothetical protein HDU98_002188 [Podochytrium sp. JEL0797]|nr:hypothetical protein HDU98_002188 [Podochytrium sp. JEL0797]